jgi:hypothetical protein
LLSGQAGATHDQPVLVFAERGLGDLRAAAGGVVDIDPCGLVDAVDRRADLSGLADGDRVAHVMVAAGGDDLVRPETPSPSATSTARSRPRGGPGRRSRG